MRLGVHVEQADVAAAGGDRRAEVGHRGRLADAAFLVDNDDYAHGTHYRRHYSWGNSAKQQAAGTRTSEHPPLVVTAAIAASGDGNTAEGSLSGYYLFFFPFFLVAFFLVAFFFAAFFFFAMRISFP
ncbi:MAG TPA: hypothetical protein VNA25_28635 [Phycisphaerae bacterium]|nr:hypothetical protein [Phycisphaerae bacterium]